MPDSQDTRDRVIALQTQMNHLVEMVQKNSGILAMLHEEHLREQGANRFARVMLGASRHLSSGGAGAGLLYALLHFGKLPT
jgi:hypothetical protein